MTNSNDSLCPRDDTKNYADRKGVREWRPQWWVELEIDTEAAADQVEAQIREQIARWGLEQSEFGIYRMVRFLVDRLDQLRMERMK